MEDKNNRGDAGERGARGDAGIKGASGDQGIQGSSGERGDTGERGVGGERGPKGDHGQHGEAGSAGKDGRDGDAGLRGLRGKQSGIVLFALTVAFITAGWYSSERHSCERQAGVREATREAADIAYDARLASAKLARAAGDIRRAKNDEAAVERYVVALENAGPLDCSGLFPDTK